MLNSSFAAKRSLFTQPKMSRVYPDPASDTATATIASGTSATSAASEESAYHSGSCSPDQTATAASAASGAPGSNKFEDDTDLRGRKCVHFDSTSPCRSSNSSSSSCGGTSCRSGDQSCCEASGRAHFNILTVSEQVDRNQRTPSFDLASRRLSTAAGPVGVSRRFSIADAAALQMPPPPTQQPELLLSPDEEQEILEASGDEFKERLKRLFGVRHSIASPQHHHHHHHHHHHSQQDRGSSPDLKQSWPSVAGGSVAGPSGGRSGRRPSLAARLFNKLPFVRRNDPADGDEEESEETGGSANGLGGGGGGAAGGSSTLRYCEVCGEADCELHGSLSEMNCCRRHLTLMGCYQTKEERERALMLENNSAARVTTLLVVLVFLGLIFALIALSALSRRSNSRSSASSFSISTTTVSYGSTTT